MDGVRVRMGSGFERVNPAQNINFKCSVDSSLTVRNQGVGAAGTSAPGAGQQHVVQASGIAGFGVSESVPPSADSDSPPPGETS